MNKMILFTEDIFKKIEEEREVLDVHAKYVIFETARIFNLRASLVELVFTVALFEEPRNIQISLITKIEGIGTDVEMIYDMLPHDSNRMLVSDGFDRFFIGTHAVRLNQLTEYNTAFYYYLLDKNKEVDKFFRLHLNYVDQMLISHIASLANKGVFVDQRSVLEMMKYINTTNIIDLKHDPEDEIIIVDHHFTKVSRNKGVLSVIFDFEGVEGRFNNLFLLSINVTNNGNVFKILKKTNHHRNKNEFINSLRGARYEGIRMIQFDNDCVNIDYINEDRFEKDAIPLTRSFFYTGHNIFNILMHQRANIFEKIVNMYM